VDQYKQHRAATVEIDLSALQHNAQLVRQHSPNARLMAAIKANAYGHGILEVANALNGIVDEFAVASIDDVMQIRQALPQCASMHINVLSGFYHADEIELAIDNNTSLVVYELEQVHTLLEYGFSEEKSSSEKALSIWLKVDTGMSRLGLAIDEFEKIVEQLESKYWVNI